MEWHLYMVRCRDKSLYVGITTDIEKRITYHNTSRGAKYTRSHSPVTLVYRERFLTKSEALKREIQIKKWSKAKKEALVSGDLKELVRLSHQ